MHTNASDRPGTFVVDDAVLLLSTETHIPMLATSLLGPFFVKERVSPNEYIVYERITNTQRRAHVTTMMPFGKHRANLELEEQHLVSGDFYIVDAVLDFTMVNNAGVKTPSFLIQWRGYDDPTWEPYANVSHVAQVKRFLEEHPDARAAISSLSASAAASV